MLYHNYYVNGEKVSEEYFDFVVRQNDYNREAFKKAEEYFARHQWALNRILNTTPKNLIANMMILEYQATPEGQEFQRKWYDKRKKDEQKWYIIGFCFWLLFILTAIIIMLCS